MVNKIFVVSAPSGAGKTTLVAAVLERKHPDYLIEKVVTYTTKAPKSGEVHGRDYYFITVDEFRSKIEQGFFLEWSTDYGHYYGSPKAMLEKRECGVSSIVILDRKGAKSLLARVPDAILIWITPPDLQILEERLLKRAREDQDQIKKRLFIAQQELAEETASKTFHYCVQNDVFENAVSGLEACIYKEIC